MSKKQDKSLLNILDTCCTKVYENAFLQERGEITLKECNEKDQIFIAEAEIAILKWVKKEVKKLEIENKKLKEVMKKLQDVGWFVGMF